MKGGFIFKLTSKRVQYEFTVKRKIMRITGDTATGKTELIRTLADTENPRSGVNVNCKYPCEVLNNTYFRRIKEDILDVSNQFINHDSEKFADALRSILTRYDNILFFADEDFSDLGTNELALFCKFTDSFFVFICRDSLSKLPCNCTEFYALKANGRCHFLEHG